MKKENREIMWNLINSLLSGLLVLFGTFVGQNFEFSEKGMFVAAGTAILVALTKFKDYWDGEKGEYSSKCFEIL